MVRPGPFLTGRLAPRRRKPAGRISRRRIRHSLGRAGGLRCPTGRRAENFSRRGASRVR